MNESILKLPHWIGIGCVKCGTSWTWREMRKHPQIFAPEAKELFYFTGGSTKPLKWYSKWFKNGEPDQLLGEWTPDYFHHYEARHRIKEKLPNVKLLVLFRHPVERAFSNWKHAVHEGRLPKNLTFDQSFSYWKIRDRGIYSKPLKKWLRLFSENQMKILWYEDIKTRPIQLLKEVFQFLDVDDSFVPENHNEWFQFSYHENDKLTNTKLEKEDRNVWLDFYLPYTEELEKLTGKNLSHWKI